MRDWTVRSVGADCTLPALACYGIPDTSPHLRALLLGAGFAEPTRVELVLVAKCQTLVSVIPAGVDVTRTLGLAGTRLTLSRKGSELGFVEVCDEPIEMARSSAAARWADVSNLVAHDSDDRATVRTVLLSIAADWLLLGGVGRLIVYWAQDIDSAEDLVELERAGFQKLVCNERGFTHQL
jgi:hypothetical protein